MGGGGGAPGNMDREENEDKSRTQHVESAGAGGG